MSHLIQRQIHAIARRARRLLVVHGVCWFTVVAVAAAFALGWVDYSLRLQDRGVRIILSLAFGVALLWSFRRFVFPSWRRRFSELEVAQQVERRFPQLGDRLSSSLDFLRGDIDANRAESASLQQAVISETEALVRPLKLDECLDPRAARRSLLACLPLLMAIGAICSLDLDATSLAARRLAVPWSDESWPRWNSLEIVKPLDRIALGYDFAVEVTDPRGRLPKDTRLQLWFEGDLEDKIETVAMQRGDDRFHYTRANVTRSFKYRAIGGDDDTMAWYVLDVVEPVRIEDFRVRVQPPAYSGIAPTDLPAGPIRVLAGSQLAISGRTTRPVQSIRLHLGIDDAVEFVAARIARDDSTFAIASPPTNAPGKGQYWIELSEADGVVSGHDVQAAWEVVPDHAPTVTVLAPTSEMVFTPMATVPIRVTAADDLALQRLVLQIGETTIPLYSGSQEPTARDNLPTNPEVREISRELDLSEFQLAPGDTLELVFVASDYKPQSSEPVTKSITIISREDFDYRAQDKQRLLLARLGEALRLHRATRSQVASLQTQLETTGELSSDDANLLRASELQQRQVARLLDDSPGGAAQLVAELISSLSSNQITGSDAASRLAHISKALDLINRERMPNLQSELVRATKLTATARDEGDDIRALLTSVGERQDVIAVELQSMIDQLAQWEDYRRFARDVAKLLRDQQKLGSKVSELPTIGQQFETLSPQQRADLARAAGEQLELARRLDRLQAEMDRLRDTIRESDPAAAAALAEALREASGNGIAEQMRGIGNDVARNRLGNASQTQSKVEQGLQQVLGALTNSNRPSADGGEQATPQQLAAALARLKAQLTDIATQQQVLLEATAQWQDAGTASPTPESLTPEQMASEQRRLLDDTREAREGALLPKAFAFGMENIETTMSAAVKRLESESPDASVHRLQSRALARLKQLLAALDSQTARAGSETAEERPLDAGADSTAPPDEPRPKLSVEELRLLHAMQLDIYQRTVALERHREEQGALESEGQQELQQLATEQGQLAELLIAALPPEDESDAPPPSPATSRELDDDLDRALEKAGIPGFGADP